MWYAAALEYTLIAGALSLANHVSPLWWYFIAVFIGTRQHAIGIVGHWASHDLTERPELLQFLCMAPMAIDSRRYILQHGMHHAGLGTLSDMERPIVMMFRERWSRISLGDSILDLLGLHLDEAFRVLMTFVTPRSIGLYLAWLGILWAVFGAAALLWPAGVVGLLFAHRLRARTEHDHIKRPGVTFLTRCPAFWRQALYLPWGTWRHAEHHAAPGRQVWLD